MSKMCWLKYQLSSEKTCFSFTRDRGWFEKQAVSMLNKILGLLTKSGRGSTAAILLDEWRAVTLGGVLGTGDGVSGRPTEVLRSVYSVYNKSGTRPVRSYDIVYVVCPWGLCMFGYHSTAVESFFKNACARW